MSKPRFEIKCDPQHVRRHFNAYIHVVDTPVLRCYLYLNGKQWVPPTGWVGKLGFFEDLDSTTMTIVNSDTASGENYFDFNFASAQITTYGDYDCQILALSEGTGEQQIFADGKLHILQSPLSGEYTEEALDKSVVNWSLVENIGLRPWTDSKEVILSNCAASPITISVNDAGKTFLVDGNCSSDVTFILPAANVSSIGSTYKFLNKSDKVLSVEVSGSDNLDDDKASVYSGANGINDNEPYAYIRIKQTEEGEWNLINGRLKWTTIDQ